MAVAAYRLDARARAGDDERGDRENALRSSHVRILRPPPPPRNPVESPARHPPRRGPTRAIAPSAAFQDAERIRTAEIRLDPVGGLARLDVPVRRTHGQDLDEREPAPGE